MVAADVLADPREASVEAMFEAAGALRRGHFALKSGRHSDRYLEKFAVLQYPTLAVEIGRRLAESLAPHDPTLVVGPTTGGVLLAFETARHLQERLGHTVRGIFAEPVGPGQRALRRGWPVERRRPDRAGRRHPDQRRLGPRDGGRGRGGRWTTAGRDRDRRPFG